MGEDMGEGMWEGMGEGMGEKGGGYEGEKGEAVHVCLAHVNGWMGIHLTAHAHVELAICTCFC